MKNYNEKKKFIKENKKYFNKTFINIEDKIEDKEFNLKEKELNSLKKEYKELTTHDIEKFAKSEEKVSFGIVYKEYDYKFIDIDEDDSLMEQIKDLNKFIEAIKKEGYIDISFENNYKYIYSEEKFDKQIITTYRLETEKEYEIRLEYLKKFEEFFRYIKKNIDKQKKLNEKLVRKDKMTKEKYQKEYEHYWEKRKEKEKRETKIINNLKKKYTLDELEKLL